MLIKGRKTDKYNPFTILMQTDPQNPKWEASIKIRTLPGGKWGKTKKWQCGVHIMGTYVNFQYKAPVVTRGFWTKIVKNFAFSGSGGYSGGVKPAC